MINKKRNIPDFLERLVQDVFLQNKHATSAFDNKNSIISSTREVFMSFAKYYKEHRYTIEKHCQEDLKYVKLDSTNKNDENNTAAKPTSKEQNNQDDEKEEQETLQAFFKRNRIQESLFTKVNSVGGFENDLSLFLEQDISEIEDICKEAEIKLAKKN